MNLLALGYCDYEPNRINEETFENLDTVILRINNDLLKDDTLGKIINVETVNIYSENRDCQDFDSENTLCCTFNESQGIIQLIRIYFNENEPCSKISIGYKDFIPEHLSGGVILKPEYESFTNISDKAMLWLAENKDAIFISAETKEAPMKSISSLDTRIMHYVLTKTGLDYIRFIRIWFAKSLTNELESYKQLKYLSNKIVATKPTDYQPMSITIEETKETISKWYESSQDIKIKGGKFIELFPKSKFDVKDELENCYQAHNMFINRTKYLAAQIYFDVGPVAGEEKLSVIRASMKNNSTKTLKSLYCIVC